MTQISKNVFSKGLSRDNDPSNISAYSMVDNINGRLMFNKIGTFDWVEDNGNSFSFTLDADSGGDPNRYTPIGYAGDGNIKVIFSVREDLAYSEIGILGTDSEGNGVYETLFNDQNDINSELLNFNPQNQIAARFLYENDETIRVYWVDGVSTVSPRSNPPRVFTFEFDKSSTRNDVSAYTPVTSTVHSINSQAEFSPGIIKFYQTLSGSIFTGVYQYTYRLLTRDGYASPWTTPTKKIFVTSDDVDNDNWNNYEMEGSGTNSGKGNEIEIKGIDQRFDRIQVAYLYSTTNTVVDESTMFIDTVVDKTVGGDVVRFTHSINSGEPVLLDEIAERFQGLSGAKTLEMKDDVLYYGNVNENNLFVTDAEIETALAGLTLTPKFRDMLSDTRDLGTPNLNNPPVTHQQVFPSGNIQKRMNQSSLEDYNVTNDYINYKGTQVDNLFNGYFRGESYRFAIVLFDLLGYPYFAYHLADFKFPEQYSQDYSWERLKLDGTSNGVVNGSLSIPASPTNDYNHTPLVSDPILENDPYHTTSYSHLRVMGLSVSGIDLSAISDRISGFSIVRTDRDVSLITQGLMMPTVLDPAGAPSTVIRPHPVAHHRYGDAGSGLELFGVNATDSAGTKFRPKENWSTLYFPETDFQSSKTPTVKTVDRLRVVGSCYKSPSALETESGINNGVHVTYMDEQPSNHDKSPQVVSKWYRSYNPYHDAVSGGFHPRYGDEASIEKQFISGLGSQIDDVEVGVDFHNGLEYRTDVYAPSGNTEGFGDNDLYHGWGKPNTQLYKHSDFTNGSKHAIFNYGGSSSYSNSTQAGNLICNYVTPNSNPYGGLTNSSIEQTIYFSTGHFQPIGNSSFSVPVSNIFDDIEIYGGDCYLDYFGFLRMYGRYDTPDEDVSYACVFPLESTLNHSLRQAESTQNPMYTDVGAKPWIEFDTPNSTNWGDALFTDSSGALIEEFNYNDVLTFSELNNFFNSRPFEFKNIDEYPVRWRHTLNKFYGDPIDSWRQFEINSFKDLTGKYGSISSSAFLFNQIYSWQETSFGRLRAFDRAALGSETTNTLTTGIGPALDGIDYISTNVGNQHQWSLVNTGKAVYWIDVFNGKSMKFAQDGTAFLSDVRGMHNYFEKESKNFLNSDNPVLGNGISSTWDAKNREVLWTWNRDEYIDLSLNFYAISDIPGAINYFGNNETVFINWSGLSSAGNGVFLPTGDTFGGNNFNVLQYVSLKDGANAMWVNQDSNNTITQLVQIQPGENYLFFRGSVNEDWQFVLVDESQITPFRATIVYSEYVQAFSQFHSFKPNFYISHNKFVISEQADIVGRDFYVHGRNLTLGLYYGKPNKSSLTIVVNDTSEFSKLFDNVRVSINEQGNDTLNRFIFSTQKQDYYYDVQPDSRTKYLEDILRLPIRRFDQKDRMRGRWLGMTLEFENTSNYPVKINNFINHYRVSNRR